MRTIAAFDDQEIGSLMVDWHGTVAGTSSGIVRDRGVIPILSVAQMRAADARAVEARGTDALVAAAGMAVALEAQSMLGSCYGARVGVLVGPGLNGADGLVA